MPMSLIDSTGAPMPRKDPNSNEARQKAHRKPNNGGLPPHPEALATQAALTSRVIPLADRVRPGSEAAPWVVDAIRQLEHENYLMRQRLYMASNPPFTGRLDSWQQAAGIARNQRDQAIAHLHKLLNSRRTATQTLQDESAAREWLESIGSEVP